MYVVKHVANSLVALGEREGISLKYPKLQGLIYLFNGIYLAITGAPVLTDKFLAAPRGPRLQYLYYQCLPFGHKPISFQYEYSIEPGEEGKLVAARPPENDSRYYGILCKVWEWFRHHDAAQLVAMATTPGGPWDVAREAGDIHLHNADIIEHFSKKLMAGANGLPILALSQGE